MKILIVDDCLQYREMLACVFKEHDIVTAADGREAMRLLVDKQANYDLILMDIMMPYMDGHELLRLIRNIDNYENIPIVVLSAKIFNVKEILDAGANVCFLKPVDILELKAAAEKLSERATS